MTSTTSSTTLCSSTDIEALYRAHARSLELIVRRDLHEVPQAVVEDACQFAWSRLVFHASRVRRETALSWLAKTAVHEAFKLIRRQAREVPLEGPGEDEEGALQLRSVTPDPYELAELSGRLALTTRIAPRQGKIVWLHAFGLSYEEIGAHSGCTPRTVQRQLLRARSSLRALSSA